MVKLTELELHDVGVPLLEDGAPVVARPAVRLQVGHEPRAGVLGALRQALAAVRHKVLLVPKIRAKRLAVASSRLAERYTGIISLYLYSGVERRKKGPRALGAGKERQPCPEYSFHSWQ